MFETVRAPHQLTRCLLPAQLTDWHSFPFPTTFSADVGTGGTYYRIGKLEWDKNQMRKKTAIMQLPWEKWRKIKDVKHKAQFSVVDIWRQTGAHFSLAFCWWVESGKSVKANIFQKWPRLIIGCQHSSAAATIKNQDTMVTYHAWRHCSSNGAVW